MKIIGINFLHSDSSCSLIIDGKVVAAVEEERFMRIKHYNLFPYNSLQYCLEVANIKISEIDFFCFNFSNKYNFFNKIKYLVNNPSLLKKVKYKRLSRQKNATDILKKLSIEKKKIKFVKHHLAHASSAYLFSGFTDAITFSFDGSGDFSCIEIFLCKQNKLKLLEKITFPNSLGLFYQMITHYLGFHAYGDEYKVMSLAAHGKNSLVKKLLHIFKIKEDNSFEIKKGYFKMENIFNFNIDLLNNENKLFYTSKLEKLLKFPPRNPNEELNQNHKNLAHATQFVFTLIAKNLIRKYEKYSENLCITGGCAFNSVFCQSVKKDEIFKNIYVMPNSGDAGGGLGAAKYISSVKDNKFINYKLLNPYLGPSFTNKYILNLLNEKKMIELFKKHKIEFKHRTFNQIKTIASTELNKGKIIFWFRGRAEFGPRALGNRSILANPLNKNTMEEINLTIKEREAFRPFAPAVIDTYKDRYFFTHKDMNNFMNFVVNTKPNMRSLIPAVVHVDGTARAQVVSNEINSDFFELIQEFGNLSGHPVLVNTSLNIQEPICNSPEDVLKTFIKSKVKNLFIEDFYIYK